MTDKVLGHATAYGYYKAGGGTMTEAEFTEFMADFGTASQTAVEAAQAALASETAARTAATTATNKASEATTAATTATTKAGEASTSASTATSAKDTAVSASQTATTKATEATTAAATATSAKTDAVAANTAAQSAKTAAQTAQTGAETAAASVQSSAAQIQENADDIAQLMSDLYQIVETTYVRGVLNADGTINTSAQGVISDVESGVNTFIVKTDCKAALALYSGSTYLGKMNANYVLDKVAGSWGYYIPGTYDVSEYLTLYGADSIRIYLVPTNGVNIPAGQENAYGQAHAEYRYYEYATLTYVNSTFAKKHGNGNNYALSTGFCKIPVAIEYLGSLNYLQAFCKYNNSYYSIEGTHITKQDANFNIQQIAVLDTGHGNSFQLGNSHYAYAFGWDDNTVYVVDLDTLTVSDTIQLPTTGYTSGVVDEINGLIYIFQRNDYPITEASFNFIVYDYINDQTISTRKTIPFGAVQACDFLDDRIFAVNGLGNSTCPNGFRIYDLKGNILSSYVLGDFATTEPEGVCIDRDTKEVMISFIDTKVYKLT